MNQDDVTGRTATRGSVRSGAAGESRPPFSSDDQWRSFQTFLAAYLAGMLHPLDVFTIARRGSVSPPLMEFRCGAEGTLRFSMGDRVWSDEPGDFILVRREDANQIAVQTANLLKGLDGIDEPRNLRLSGSGPASAVAVLAQGGFLSFGDLQKVHPARLAAHIARMDANIDIDGDVIEAAARQEGDRVYASMKNGSIAAIAAARRLAQLRTWVDPFSPTPQSGYLVGKPREEPEASPA